MSLTAYHAPKPNTKLEQVQMSEVYKGMRVSLLMFCIDNFMINGGYTLFKLQTYQLTQHPAR